MIKCPIHQYDRACREEKGAGVGAHNSFTDCSKCPHLQVFRMPLITNIIYDERKVNNLATVLAKYNRKVEHYARWIR